MTLSKSQYIRGLQCHKSLWLYKNRPELRSPIDAQTQSLFKSGDSVGELAKELFPDGTEIAFTPDDFQGMITKTKELIERGQEVIYEATFSQNGIFAMADILVKNGSSWDMYEVKSSTHVKEYHTNDASIQWFALSSVINLNRAFIVHINNRYVREKSLDVHGLFTIVDVTDVVKENQSLIPKKLDAIEKMLKRQMPVVDIGAHCHDPFRCDFYEHCHAHIPYPSIFNLYWLRADKKYALYQQGIVHYKDLPKEQNLTKTQSIQIETFNRQKPYIDKGIIKTFLNDISYPINFFDFETFQNAIPRFENQRSYEQIPFQYSLHILHEDGELQHKEFLADEQQDPREALIKHMLADITPKGSIIAYNKGFEMGVIRRLAEFSPESASSLLALNERFIDLIVPFRNLGYYHPNFHGSFSLKSVLPALFPNDKELDYKALDIQDGGMAMDTFANLHLLKDKNQREKIRADLLAYCKLDTLAMVRIWEKLRKEVKSLPKQPILLS